MLELQPERLLFECLPKIFKKPVLVLATSASVILVYKEIRDRAENNVENRAIMLEKVLCIYYLLCFQKDKKSNI